MTAPLLTLTDVTFGYGAAATVADIALAVRGGQILGLLGPNGAGKSTLMRLAAGLLRPRGGRVALAGRDLRTLSRTAIARRIAVLPQGAPLPADFTGRQLVLMGRAPHLGWLAAEGACDEAIARRALALVEATDLAGRRLGELSGGERQRLLLARALAQEPEVLLLDEPTVHLDLAHQLAVLDLVRDRARSDGLAVLAVFHDLNLAAHYCDELALLARGRIVARGAPQTVLTPDIIQQVYGIRLGVVPHPESGQPTILLPPARQTASRAADSAAPPPDDRSWTLAGGA